MRAEGRAALDVPAGDALEVLHAVDGWPSWVPGLARLVRGETVYAGGTSRPQRVEVDLVLRAPRDLHLRLAVGLEEHGVRLALVQGDATSVDGEITVAPADGGCELAWRLDVLVPFAVPGALAEELSQEVVPRWVEGLRRALDAGPRQAD